MRSWGVAEGRRRAALSPMAAAAGTAAAGAASRRPATWSPVRGWLLALVGAVLLNVVDAQTKAGEGPGADDANERGPCTTCIFVLERLKQGVSSPREEVCEEVWFNSLTPHDYQSCFDTLEALDMWQGHFDAWANEGCFRKESYGFLRGGLDMILVKPCPSHVICGVLANPNTLSGTPATGHVVSEAEAVPFCPKSKEEYDQSFFSDDNQAQKRLSARGSSKGLGGDRRLRQLATPPLLQLLHRMKTS